VARRTLREALTLLASEDDQPILLASADDIRRSVRRTTETGDTSAAAVSQ
jgi:hypothetical protein